MGAGSRPSVTTDGRSVLLDLRNKQRLFKRDSGEWMAIQQRIDTIVAQNFLEYQNRGEGYV